MSIKITSIPSTYSTVYNPIYLSATSSLTNEESFNFIFDTYVNDVFVTRNNLFPKPGTIGTEFSPARVLESYVSYDLSHNIVTETVSQNCIREYEIEVGEEFILYWDFLDTQYDSFSASSYTVLMGTSSSTHGYQVDDYILVSDTVYGYYNGVHKVVGVPNNYSVIINKNFTSTPTNPGRSTWSDKRKFELLGQEMLLNPDITTALGYWTTYGPDGCGVEISLSSDVMILTIPDISCGNYWSSTASSYPFEIGQLYDIEIEVSSIYNPSDEAWAVYGNLGGEQTPAINTLGTTIIKNFKCGTYSNIFALDFFADSDTGSFGTHQFEISYVSVKQSPVRGYFFNGVCSYEELPVWDYTQYELVDSNSKFLTKQPSTVKTSINDRGSIGLMNLGEINPVDGYGVLLVSGTDTTGSPTIPLTFTLSYFGDLTNVNNRILELPAYPWNLNELSQSLYGVDVISPGVASYSVSIFAYDIALDTFKQLSEFKTFELDRCGTRFEPVRFMFLNSLGQFDYFNATLLSRTTINVSRDTYTKTLSSNYQQGDRGRTIINVNAQEKYIVTTDWVSQETAHWLTYEFVTSNEVYVLDNSTGKITPIILDITDWEDKKRVNDKLLNYTISYTKSVDINTKRN